MGSPEEDMLTDGEAAELRAALVGEPEAVADWHERTGHEAPTLLAQHDEIARLRAEDHSAMADYWRSVPLPDGVEELETPGDSIMVRWKTPTRRSLRAKITGDGCVECWDIDHDGAATKPGVVQWLVAQWSLRESTKGG